MEDVLDVYARPLDENRPVVCMDEFCKQLLSESRTPLPARPGEADGKKGARRRQDAEYVREGSGSGFMICAPKLGRREVYVSETAKRTAIDYAHAVRFLCDDMFPAAEKIVLVQDNLNTHNPASLYKAFPPCEARRLAQRIEWHYTPKHGSWLNIAEIEISVLSRSSLKGRIPDVETFRKLARDDAKRRNGSGRPVKWQFTTDDARVKLRRLYPSI
jgi:hypothetical protein